jgi:DNA-binding beta-propeller fold protein YncE
LSEGSGGGPGGFAVGVGSLVAGYRLEQQIGQGGMAVVYRAHDSRLDRNVALKVLAPALAADDSFRQRFIRESRAAAAVDDAHIIPVYEAGEEHGVLFIAMRFVRGGDVRTLLDAEGPLSPERATEILSQTASALDAAHARGLVHRDVKPANMLLEASADRDRPDHVYLSDFGLAKGSLAITGLTSTGQFLGTLDYIAPEQVEGRPVDGRADQYALGCVAFELLTGQPPFQRDQGMAVMYAQVSEPPPLLSSRRAGLPPGVDDALNRVLAKAPGERYASCREFAAELRRLFNTGSGPRTQPGFRAPTQLARPPGPGPGAASGGAAGREDWAAARGNPAASGERAASGDLPESWFRPAPATPPRGTPPPRTVPPQPRPGGGTDRSGPAAEPPTQGIGGPPRPGTTPGLTPLGGYQGYGAAVPAASPGRPRSWRKSPLPLALIGALVIVLGGGGYFLASKQNGGTGGTGGSDPKEQAAVGAIVTPPACSTSAAALKPLTSVSLGSVFIGGNPFAVVQSPDGTYTFASDNNELVVLRSGSGLAPFVQRTYTIKGVDKGMVLTPDGKYLLAAGNDDAIVISVQEAENGAANPVTGVLDTPGASKGGAAQVLASPDSKYVFVTLQNTTTMAVFNLADALASGFNPHDFVGFVPLNVQPVGIGASPDGRWLYVTSFLRAPGSIPAPGTLSVVSMTGAETDPAKSVKTVVTAGCSPARAVSDGKTVWVTARDSNTVLAFSAARLLSDPQHALLANVPVGQTPTGEILIDGGKRLVIADSNENSSSQANGDLAVIDTAKALAGPSGLLGVVPVSGQPRQLAVADNGTVLFVVNQVSRQLQALKISDLP